MNLTPKMRELLDYIEFHIGECGCAPSYDEMKDGLGLASKSGIHRLITSLEKRGYIRRSPYMARTIEIINRTPVTVGDGAVFDLLKRVVMTDGVYGLLSNSLTKELNDYANKRHIAEQNIFPAIEAAE